MPILRVVLDTNVLISGILFGGKPRQIIELVIKGKIKAYLSPAILAEFKDVIARPKFGLGHEVCFAITREIEDIFSFVFPEIVIERIKVGPDDNAILECALAADAEYIVTGDPHLLNIDSFEEIRVITPSIFISECIE
jgi:putative PIN family toxin of toxin-antitoxin system